MNARKIVTLFMISAAIVLTPPAFAAQHLTRAQDSLIPLGNKAMKFADANKCGSATAILYEMERQMFNRRLILRGEIINDQAPLSANDFLRLRNGLINKIGDCNIRMEPVRLEVCEAIAKANHYATDAKTVAACALKLSISQIDFDPTHAFPMHTTPVAKNKLSQSVAP